MRTSRPIVIALAAALSTFALAACGSSNNSSPSSSPSSSQGGPDVAPFQGKKGGVLPVQSAEGFEHLDPGESYFQGDYEVVYAVHRPLFSYKPDDVTHSVPDLASEPAKISSDGKTVTVKIRPDVKYSPPVNRVVTSADVKYAIERGFSTTTASGYAAAYFGLLEGAPKTPTKAVPNIKGIETPDKTTIVFHLTSNFGGTMVQALSLPLSAPVPEEYAKKYDAHAPSTFDTDPTKQAFTGPYMITSYSTTKGITLKRNPNWDPKTDFRPAYVDEIDWKTGGDSAVISQQVVRGDNGLMSDSPPPEVLQQVYKNQRDQVAFTGLSSRYVALNTKKKPFDDINVRKAVIAVTDKFKMNLVRGGALIGTPGTHILPPGAPGFDEAGGDKGFGLDYMDTPHGDLKLAEEYMKKAGFASGKYSGPQVEIVGSSEDPAPKGTAVFVDGLKQLGFKVKLVQVLHTTMYAKFCNVPANAPEICTNVGWIPNFQDGYAYLWVPFNGSAISPENNANWPQLDNPQIDKAMRDASTISDPGDRAKAWANVDKLITEQAPVVMWQWSKDAKLKGKKVHGVMAQWNSDWDLSWSSLG
jgi:peptide/nickel transport system substrate-binding protein